VKSRLLTAIHTALLCATLLAAAHLAADQGTNDPQPDRVIIDVRSIEEWNSGHLAAAQHLELQTIAASIEQQVPDKQQRVYLYCRSGNRSGKAKAIIEQLGYTNVVNAGAITNASILLDQAIVQ
jgi:phage shock protein E